MLDWSIVGGIGGDLRRIGIGASDPGFGILLSPGGLKPQSVLTLGFDHSDLVLDFDFILSPDAILVVSFQGIYRVEIGGWKSGRVRGNGSVPVDRDPDAGRAPGLWQHAHLEFVAPRFDAAGKKTARAHLAKMVINDFLVQSDFVLENALTDSQVGPSAQLNQRTEIVPPIKPSMGPLVFRDNGLPVALRRISYVRSGLQQMQVTDLAYQVFAGEFRRIGDYDNAPPKSAGRLEKFSQSAVEKAGRYGLVITGGLDVAQDDDYLFSVDGADPTRLIVDDLNVVSPSERGGQPGSIHLTPGLHRFRLDYLRATTSGRPALEMGALGKSTGWQMLTTADSSLPRSAPPVLKIDPTDRVLVQRGFVPFEPKKRLYAVSVGTPQGVHYAYDLETTALLRVWRGRFLDTGEMWVNRGENQYSKPAGPALTLSGLPSVALIEMPQSGGWPDRPDPLMTPQGYTLEPDGQPVFLTKLTDVLIKDRIAPSAGGRGLARRLEFSGALPSWQVCVLLADAESITPQPDGSGWIVGDRSYYLDWPKDSPHQPVLRNRGGHQLLVVPLSKATLGKPLSYEIVW
jgi:hypothetical protein